MFFLFLSSIRQTCLRHAGQGPEEHLHVHDGHDAGDGDGLQAAPPRGLLLPVHQLQGPRTKHHQGLGGRPDPEKHPEVPPQEAGEGGEQEEGGGEEEGVEEEDPRFEA